MSQASSERSWAVVLGGSSGFGLATAEALARHGVNLCVVHRDRRGAMARIEPAFERIRRSGVQLRTHNCDALSVEGRHEVLDALTQHMHVDGGKVSVLLHSIAFGNLKPIVAPPGGPAGPERGAPALLEEEDMARTIHAMGTSFLTWTQDLHARGLFAPRASVLGLTSEGNQVAWRGYAAVSAAKAALEAVSRSIAVEFAPYGIRSNIVQAGVTDTPALRLIPGCEQLMAQALQRNPFGRLTTTQDVAEVLCLLSRPEAAWINGEVIRVDGGEHIAGAIT